MNSENKAILYRVSKEQDTFFFNPQHHQPENFTKGKDTTVAELLSWIRKAHISSAHSNIIFEFLGESDSAQDDSEPVLVKAVADEEWSAFDVPVSNPDQNLDSATITIGSNSDLERFFVLVVNSALRLNPLATRVDVEFSAEKETQEAA